MTVYILFVFSIFHSVLVIFLHFGHFKYLCNVQLFEITFLSVVCDNHAPYLDG